MDSASEDGFGQRDTLQWCHYSHACASRFWKPLPHCAMVTLVDIANSFMTSAACVLFVAEFASGECFRLFCTPGDDVILTTGFGVVLPQVCFWSSLNFEVSGSRLVGGRMVVADDSRPDKDVSGSWKS